MFTESMTDTVVVHNGVTSQKFIDGEMEHSTVTPFVAADKLGLGVGLSIIRPDGTTEEATYLHIYPHNLIRSWRAMKLLETMASVEAHGSMGLCFELAKEKMALHADTYSDEFGQLYGDFEKSREVRANILASYPSPDTLASMRAVLKKLDLKIDLEEIKATKRKLEAPEVILKRLIADDFDRSKRVEQRAATAAAQAVEAAKHLKIPNPATLPKKKTFIRRFFGR